MKIKRKVQKTLPQLIEYAWENDITNKEYVCNEHKAKSVIFNLSGWAEFSDEFSYNPEETFTVTIKEEITEDTEFKRLVCINDNDRTVPFSNFTIREIKDVGVKEFHAYIDGEFKLIWRDGILIE